MEMNECVIASILDNNTHDTILFKNRDRGYKPNLEIVRELVDDVECVYLRDIDTDWSEGMNSNGIGIINSALAVGYDENEKKIIKKVGKKSHDGQIIREALYKYNIKESVKTLVRYESGIRGHTIIANKKKYLIIESTSKHNPKYKIGNGNVVRTNHGYYHIDAGYTSGMNYLSSKVRKSMGEDFISSVKYYKDLPRVMRKQINKNPQMNPTRMSGKLFTTSQILMNLNKLEFNVYILNDKINSFNGISKIGISDDYSPKIKINVYRV